MKSPHNPKTKETRETTKKLLRNYSGRSFTACKTRQSKGGKSNFGRGNLIIMSLKEKFSSDEICFYFCCRFLVASKLRVAPSFIAIVLAGSIKKNHSRLERNSSQIERRKSRKNSGLHILISPNFENNTKFDTFSCRADLCYTFYVVFVFACFEFNVEILEKVKR
jgi:hypothetical protein